MENFRTKEISVKLCCTCINEDYFSTHYRRYYEYLSFETKKNKLYGTYVKSFYKLRPYEFFVETGLSDDLYCELPFFVCASKIY